MTHTKFKVLSPGQSIYFAKVEFLFSNTVTATRRVVSGPMPIVAVSGNGTIVDGHGDVTPQNILYNTVDGRHPATQCFTTLAAAEKYIATEIAQREKQLLLIEKERSKVC